MDRLHDAKVNLKEQNTLSLAFIGDGVYELFVRDYLVSLGNIPVKKLNAMKVGIVNCAAQAHVFREYLQEQLTQEEQEVCRRGRNAHLNRIPKNASYMDYHDATALECLFGYLYLKPNPERLRFLFDIIKRYLPDMVKKSLKNG